MPSVNDVIVHCQKQIKKEPPEEKLLHYLSRLDRLRVTVQDLMDTGVGRTVNQLSRHDGEVGRCAAELVRKWKEMVKEEEEDEESEDSESGSSDEDLEIVEQEVKATREEKDEDGESEEEDIQTQRLLVHRYDREEQEEGEGEEVQVDVKRKTESERHQHFHHNDHHSSKHKGSSEERRKEDLQHVSHRHKNHKKDKKSDRHGHHSHKTKHKDKDRNEEHYRGHGSGSNRDKDREHQGKERERNRSHGSEKRKRENSSSPERKKRKVDEIKHDKTNKDERKLSKKTSIHIDQEINSESGVRFEELLGCLDGKLTKSKHKHKHKAKDKRDDKSRNDEKTQKASSSSVKEEVTKLVRPTSVDRGSDPKKLHLETSVSVHGDNISPNYKPSVVVRVPKPATVTTLTGLDSRNRWEDACNDRIFNSSTKETEHDAEDALSSMMSSRNQRTKVFSGRSVGHKGAVPNLFDLCMQVIQDNLGELGYTGGVPYDILKPALERATAFQLWQIEEYNPYLIGSTDELWKFHCNREFRGQQRQELESWRELYERCIDERDKKFDMVKQKLLQTVEVSEPLRKAKLAYVEPIGGPRFNRQKAATIKNGMKTLKMKEEKGARKGLATSASAGFNNPTDNSKIIEEHAVIIHPESRQAQAPASSMSRSDPAAKLKPRKAPLMAKTMKFIKTLQRR